MVSFKASGYCSPAGECDAFRLQVRVFQRECDFTHTRIESFILRVKATHNTNNDSFCSINESMNRRVTAGDVVGVRVLPRNSNLCSFWPIIESNGDIVLYSPTNDINDLEISQDVLLNVQVSIGNC